MIMRKSFILIFVLNLTVFVSFGARKIPLKGWFDEKQILSLVESSNFLNIDDYVQAYLEDKAVSVEFLKIFRMPVTITVFDEKGDVVYVRGGLVIPRFEQLNLNNCGAGKYKLLIEDYAGTYLYGDFVLE